MSRTRIPIGEKIAIGLSVAALLVSIWSLVESRRVSNQARWAEFRATTLETLAGYREAYSHALCVLRASNTKEGVEAFERAKRNLDELEGSLNELRGRSDEALSQFEALLDKSNASFRSLVDSSRDFKTNLTEEELARVGAICGESG